MSSLYVETSVISYLTARPSRDLITAARQQVTHEWWARRRSHFTLYLSQVVLGEAAAGDPAAAAERLARVGGISLLNVSDAATVLARRLQDLAAFPARSAVDALHVAVATVHGMDYLLTWNLRHIANAEQRPLIDRTCRAAGYRPPVICTPDELMGGLLNG